MIIATSGLLSLSISMATYRETGVLRRLQAAPLRPQTILVAQVVVLFLMTVLGMALLITVGKLVYSLRFGGNAFNVLLAFILRGASVFGV